MKKDLPLIMERTIYTYVIILFVVFMMKLIGLDYFGISMSSPFIMQLDKLLEVKILFNIICFLCIMIYQHIMTSIILKDKCYKLTLFSCLFTILLNTQLKKVLIPYNLNAVADILYLFILCKLYNKNVSLKRFCAVMLFNMLLQAISMITRYNYSLNYINSPAINLILNIDYMIMMLMSYKLIFMKGANKLCLISQEQVGSFLQKLTLLKKQLRKCLTRFSNSSKKERFEFIVYFVLFLLWNMFTMLIVLFIAQLNHTFIECIFIITSFWLNKTIFGKAFHLKNALHCFVLSNVSYYILDRLSTTNGISIIIPIFLGIALAYITSRFTRRKNKKLYRGMSEEELKEVLDKVTNNQLDYKICKYYYVDRYSEVKVAMLTCYSVINIKKRKQAINNKIKELLI